MCTQVHMFAFARACQADATRREELAAALKREFEEFEHTARDELAARIAALRERAKKDGDNYEALDPPSRAIVDDKLGQEESLEETLEVIEQVRIPIPQKHTRADTRLVVTRVQTHLSAQLAEAPAAAPVPFTMTLEDLSLEQFDETAKQEFIADLARGLGVEPDRVALGTCCAGSLVIEGEVSGFASAEDAAAISNSLAEGPPLNEKWGKFSVSVGKEDPKLAPLRKQLSELEHELSTATAARNAASEARDALQGDHEALRSRADKLEASLAAARAEVDSLRAKLSEAQGAVVPSPAPAAPSPSPAAAPTDSTDQKAEITRLEREAREMKLQLELALARCETSDAKTKDVEEQRSTTHAQLDEANGRLQNLLSEKGTLAEARLSRATPFRQL
jgi:predicted  nucleic acid-binding Zn-ribbon protein